MTRVLIILYLLLLFLLALVGCTPEPQLPPHGCWIVENQGVRYWVYWCPYHGKLLIDGTIIKEQQE